MLGYPITPTSVWDVEGIDVLMTRNTTGFQVIVSMRIAMRKLGVAQDAYFDASVSLTSTRSPRVNVSGLLRGTAESTSELAPVQLTRV